MRERVRHLPNQLTYLRILLIPLFVILMIEPSDGMVYLATFVFVVAAFTDYLDGMIARKYGVTSNLGMLLDPLADKILVMSALVMLVGLRSDTTGEPWVPSWMVVMVLAREIWVTGLRAIAASRGVIVEVSNHGKWKTAVQIFAIILLLLHYPFRIGDRIISLEWLGVNLLCLSLLFSYLSAIEYTMIAISKVDKD